VTRVVFLSGDPAGASARHRIDLLRPALAEREIDGELIAFPTGWLARRRLTKTLAAADAVLVQRRLPSRPEISRLRAASKRLIFDFDDALPFHVSTRGAGESPMRMRRFCEMVTSADVVTAGSDNLAELATEHGAGDVRVVPTAPDLARVRARTVADQPGDELPSIGFIGSSATLPYLESIRSALGPLGGRARLVIIADEAIDVNNLDVELDLWSEETEAASLARLDVGLAPLTNDEWARGKCGLRALQYGAAGVACVASPIGAQAEIVTHGETGLHARTTAEWTGRIEELIADAALRRRLGRAARKMVEARYSPARCGRLLADAIEGV